MAHSRHAEIVAEHAEFLRAGGVVSLAEWVAMVETEREARADAGHLVAMERAGLVGLAVSNPAAFEALLQGRDASEVAEEDIMRGALRAALDRIHQKPQGGPA